MTSAIDLTHDCNLQINLGWNVTDSKIKLRSSAIIFNNEGHATDAVIIFETFEKTICCHALYYSVDYVEYFGFTNLFSKKIQFQNPCGCGGGVTHATIGI